VKIHGIKRLLVGVVDSERRQLGTTRRGRRERSEGQASEVAHAGRSWAAPTTPVADECLAAAT